MKPFARIVPAGGCWLSDSACTVRYQHARSSAQCRGTAGSAIAAKAPAGTSLTKFAERPVTARTSSWAEGGRVINGRPLSMRWWLAAPRPATLNWYRSPNTSARILDPTGSLPVFPRAATDPAAARPGRPDADRVRWEPALRIPMWSMMRAPSAASPSTLPSASPATASRLAEAIPACRGISKGPI